MKFNIVMVLPFLGPWISNVSVVLASVMITATTSTRQKALRADSKYHNNIVDGTQTEGQEFPFFVQGEFGCGATLIAPDIVLGVAHCQNFYGSKVLVGPYVSRDTSDGKAQYRKIQGDKLVHPKHCNTTNPSYDFMLFKIQPVDLPNLQPVMLNTDLNRPVDGEDLTAVGFGATAWNASGSPNLLKASLKYIPTETCEVMLDRMPGSFDESVLCSLGRNSASCFGDSGGPVLDENMSLVGVVDFGTTYCSPSYPSGSMRVSAAMDWILNETCRLTDSFLPFCSCSSPTECAKIIKEDCSCGMSKKKLRSCISMAARGRNCCLPQKSGYLDNTFKVIYKRCKRAKSH